MKHTTKFALATLLLLVMMPAYGQRSDRAKRIGDRMWCMCGCRQILTQCNHVGCSVSTAMLKKLDQLVERNEPDDLVIQAFVQEYGPAVLAEPPAKGLALAGYVMPGVALLGGLFLFVFALQLIKSGARSVVPLLENLDVAGPANALGFGWLAAYLALSGSPVAAIGTTLLAGGVFDEREAFAVIGGSRLGASFIVLAVGYALYVGGRRSADGLSIGVVSLLTTFTTQGPAIGLGLVSLHYGWLDSVQFTPPAGMLDWIDTVYGRPIEALDGWFPAWVLFGLGVGVLLGSFALFDRALPRLEAGSPGFERQLRRLDSRWLMFGLGCAVTAMTLSVSISLTLLVPLSLKGYVRREQVIPYVMGANITTFIDTLAGAIVLGGAAAFTVVLTEMLAVAIVSGVILLLAYEAYSRVILALASRATRSTRSLGVFLAVIVAAPLALMLI